TDNDGDGVADSADAFPLDKTESVDTDGDGTGNNADLDDDNDSWSDTDEVRFGSNPLDKNSRPADLDNDHIADSEDSDIDGDGINNDADKFPTDPSETMDTDNDGTGDNADLDDDNDGWSDSDEKRLNSDPKDASDKPADLDNDHIADSEDSDIDGDGISNDADKFPADPSESIDTDNDGTGDNADLDDDNDGFSDLDENRLGTDSKNSSSKPSDSDGDGVVDADDAFPQDRFETRDTDNDGWGDFASSDDDGDGIADSIDSTPAGETVEIPEFTEALIYYKRDNADYDGWGLHVWNNESCDSVKTATQWDAPYTVTETTTNNGVLFRIALKENHGECVNFIIHKANQDSLIGDQKIELMKGNTVYAFNSSSALYYNEASQEPLAIEGVSAHWLALDKLAWSDSSNADHYELWASINGSSDLNKAEEFTRISLTNNGTINDGLYPHLNGRKRYSVDINAADAKLMLKKQLITVALNAENKVLAATRVQFPFVIDDLYTAADNDADEARMGAWIESGASQFSLWAPTAKQVQLYLYDADKTPLAQSPLTMTEDPVTGIWSYTGDASLAGSFYRYRLQVFHPKTNKIEWVMTTDPYSVSLSTDSRYSQLVDLSQADSKPDGWDEQSIPAINKPEDNIIYELHVRDFSGSDQEGTAAYNGKYLAFTENQRSSVKHLQDLKDAGLTTVHLLPTFDISSVIEDPAKRIDLNDDISKLCDADNGLKPTAAICSKSTSGTIQSILEGLDPATGEAQSLMADIRPLDGFNWGYDPYHYNAPEGSYAVESEGIVRIKEYRIMVKTLHDMGFRVVQDVVFNHMSSSALYNSSVLDKVVPGYYHRRNPDNGYVESSTCCDNTASEHRMFEKLVSDSLVLWAQEYKIDGFRFDLMGHLMKSSIEKALVEVKKVDQDNWFYGEGWDFGEVQENKRGINASSWNMAATGIGTYNDRLRDAVRGASSDTMNSAPGFANGADRAVDKIDLIRLGMTGNLQEYPLLTTSGATVLGRDYDFGGKGAGYAADPVEAVNYVSKHDNQTLWDIIQYKAQADISSADRARMQILGLAPVMLGQGVPFLHMGTELLRSKSMERDSYDSGDWYNRVDFSKQSNNWNVGLPRTDKDGNNWDTIKGIIANPNTVASAADINWTNERFKEMMTIRSQSGLLHLGTTQEIKDRVSFHNAGPSGKQNTIVMTIDDGVSVGDDLDPAYQAMAIAINASIWEQRVSIPGADDFELHPVLAAGNDPRLTAARVENGELLIPGLSAVVFVKKQSAAEQGAGMDVGPLSEDIFLRGSFSGDGWPTLEKFKFSYKGQGQYEAKAALTSGVSHSFKLGSSDWDPQYNADNLSAVFGTLAWANDAGNLKITTTTEGEYLFQLNLSDLSSAKLNITAPDAKPVTPPPFADEAVYLRGSLTDWDAGSQMTYIGDGKYSTSVYLRPGEYQFKLASADWSTVKLQYGDLFASVNGLALADAGYDTQIKITVTESGLYTFELDASDTEHKILAVKSENSGSAVNETMMQYFHWYNSEEDNLWNKVSDQAQALADSGITALWLPPAYKAMKRDDGKLGVGYSIYDLYDLGEFNQQETVRTKYGDKDAYLTAITNAHAAGVKIYADVVLNHKMGADSTEVVTVVKVEDGNRNAEYGDNFEIDAWTKFDFPGRGDQYSDFKWSWYHFDGTDWDQRTEQKAVYKFRGTGKSWDSQVSSEFGNYDYLMGADLDMGHPDVVEELKKWGKWYADFAELDGFRLDAIKHIETGFFKAWIDSVQSSTDTDLFTVGEYWDPDLGKLKSYLKDTGYRMSLFDAPLHYNFHTASKSGGGYDMGGIMNGTLMQSNPAHAVTLVENHDTQSLQALESPVEDWFKPLAYAFILLRQEGYPNIFYADYYGADYTDKGKDGNDHTINMNSHKAVLDKLLAARRDYAYGKQNSYLDNKDVIGWTRQGNTEHLQGLAVLMSDAAGGTKVMAMGAENADECFVDITGNHDADDTVCTDAEGSAAFKVKGGSVSVWVGGHVKPEPDPDAPTTVSVTLTCENVTTYDGQSVYAVGSVSELGGWTADDAVALSTSPYPNWVGKVDIPVNTVVEWKCIKKAGGDAQWSGGGNNSFTTPASGEASSTGYFSF
uniref:alpha-amylase n=1 Tax=Psychromonas ossibalaenae TaxID=444922 RepID=UPI000688512C